MSTSSVTHARKNKKASQPEKPIPSSKKGTEKAASAKKKSKPEAEKKVEAKEQRNRTKKVFAQTDGMDEPKGAKPILDVSANLQTLFNTAVDKISTAVTGKQTWEREQQEVLNSVAPANGTAANASSLRPQRPLTPLAANVGDLWKGWDKYFANSNQAPSSPSNNGSRPVQSDEGGAKDYAIDVPTITFGSTVAS